MPQPSDRVNALYFHPFPSLFSSLDQRPLPRTVFPMHAAFCASRSIPFAFQNAAM